MRKLIFNVVVILLIVASVLLNGIRLYNTNGYSTFEIASVKSTTQVSDNNYTLEVMYPTDTGSSIAIITDVPDWVMSKINANNEIPVYFHNGNYTTPHVIPYTPLQEFTYQSLALVGVSYVILIIGNSIGKRSEDL